MLFGGRGNAEILTERRTSLLARLISRVATFKVDRNVGTVGVDTACRDLRRGVGRPDAEGVRIASFEGVEDFDGVRRESDGLILVLRVFAVGRGGNADVGGSSMGGARDSVVAMMFRLSRHTSNCCCDVSRPRICIRTSSASVFYHLPLAKAGAYISTEARLADELTAGYCSVCKLVSGVIDPGFRLGCRRAGYGGSLCCDLRFLVVVSGIATMVRYPAARQCTFTNGTWRNNGVSRRLM